MIIDQSGMTKLGFLLLRDFDEFIKSFAILSLFGPALRLLFIALRLLYINLFRVGFLSKKKIVASIGRNICIVFLKIKSSVFFVNFLLLKINLYCQFYITSAKVSLCENL